MKAMLVIEDGTVFDGVSFGAEGEAVGEIIFNTQVVGFQEIVTDPSYAGKIVALGYPHVGNAGINDESNESDAAHVSALVVKEYSKVYSNWQAKGSLGDFMKKNKVIGIEGIDTRTLTVHIREQGEMKAIVSTEDFNKESLLKKLSKYSPKSEIRNPKYETKSKGGKSQTVIVDLGVNKSTLEKYEGATVVSSDTTAEKILKLEPEQVVLSSGPGDPRKLTDLIEEVKKLVGKTKLYGLQNGACVLALALGCPVYKMKVGHHGVNHPVIEPKSGRGEISAQNHSYGIEKSVAGVEIVYVNLNDKTIEKFKSKDGSCVGTLYFPIDERGKLEKGYKLV